MYCTTPPLFGHGFESRADSVLAEPSSYGLAQLLRKVTADVRSRRSLQVPSTELHYHGGRNHEALTSKSIDLRGHLETRSAGFADVSGRAGSSIIIVIVALRDETR